MENNSKNINKKQSKSIEDKLKENFYDYPSVLKLVKDNFDPNSYIKLSLIAQNHIKDILKKSEINNKYNFIFLIKEESISQFDLDQIYQSISKIEKNDKGLALVINSPGGSVEPAYLISKCCQEYNGKFIVIIQRKAKSAATLISLGAEQIHMGAVSELGPIDPQFNGLPALALSNAVEYIASLQKEYPESASMFSEYLKSQLNLNILGYFKRITESTKDYANILLNNNPATKKLNCKEIAEKLVMKYLDHSFVIDNKQAKNILGDIIISSSEEYDLANKIYLFLENLSLSLWVIGKKNVVIEYSGSYFSISDKK